MSERFPYVSKPTRLSAIPDAGLTPESITAYPSKFAAEGSSLSIELVKPENAGTARLFALNNCPSLV